jgi:hypothetical protein
MKIGQAISTTSTTKQLSWVLFEELRASELIKKFLAIYRTPRFITVFARARYWFLSWARWIQSTASHPISLKIRSILIYSRHSLGVPSGPLPSDFPTKKLYAVLSHACYMHYLSHCPWFHNSNNMLWKASMKSCILFKPLPRSEK